MEEPLVLVLLLYIMCHLGPFVYVPPTQPNKQHLREDTKMTSHEYANLTTFFCE